jgi:hypothetical protein
MVSSVRETAIKNLESNAEPANAAPAATAQPAPASSLAPAVR